MTFTSGDSATPMASLFNQAVDEGKAYTDDAVGSAALVVIPWTTFSPTASANFSTGACRYRMYGGIAEIRLTASYSGPTLTTTNSDGDIGDKSVFSGGGFPAGILPSDMQYVQAWKSLHGRIAALIQPSGSVLITDMTPGSSFASGNGVNIKAIYMVG